MARIKIDLPENFNFSVDIPVRIGDVNYGGHVGNDAILSIMHDARLLYFKSLGHTELEFFGVATIMADSAVIYKGESFFGDVITVKIIANDFHKYGFDLVYKLENQKGKDIAHGKTGIICFDYENHKITLLPENAKTKLGG